MTQLSRIEAPAAAVHKRIQDFGEHIPGARKDLLGSRIVSAAVDGDLPQKLTEAWPAPPWEKLAEAHAADGRDPDELAFLRAVRDHLRTRHGWRNEHWLCRPGQDGGGLLQVALAVMDGTTTVQQGLARVKALGDWTGTYVAHATKLYRHAGHARDLGALRCFEQCGNWNIGRPATGSRRGLYRIVVSGDTLAEAAAKLPKVLARLDERAAERKKDGSGPCPYQIRWLRSDEERLPRYGIWRQHAGRWIRVYECAARRKKEAIAEAQERIREHRDELDAWFERWRAIPAARNARDEPRTPAGDAGTDDPEEFTRRFAFRGVQFGNWVSAARRRTDLADASQGFEDLAAVLGWPARTLSLGGALGLAFGARGQGGPQRTRAHYEPALRVIAISKPTGPGSLAHEWFHAFDHEASRLTNPPPGRLRHRRLARQPSTPTPPPAGSPRRCTATARLLQDASDSRQTLGQAGPAQAERRSPTGRTTRELAARAFEAWIRWRLAPHRHPQRLPRQHRARFALAGDPTSSSSATRTRPQDELHTIDQALGRVADAGRILVPQWLAERNNDRRDGPSAETSASRSRRPALSRG